jgi:hypothetical protein
LLLLLLAKQNVFFFQGGEKVARQKERKHERDGGSGPNL